MALLLTDVEAAGPARPVIEGSTSTSEIRRVPPIDLSGTLFTVRVPFEIVGSWSTSAGTALSIEKTPGVCGGAARIAGTRIPVWTLVRFRQLGATDRDLLTFYPTLTQQNLAEAWAYEAGHRDEIAAQILQNEA
jgi:uncharacterized protein (DUF433 family)